LEDISKENSINKANRLGRKSKKSKFAIYRSINKSIKNENDETDHSKLIDNQEKCVIEPTNIQDKIVLDEENIK